MFILTEGRRPLLEFLRNITPQALLLSASLLIGVNLDFHAVDWTNWKATVAFFSCALVFLAAFFANASAFVEASVASLAKYERAARRLTRKGMRLWRPAVGTLRIVYRKSPVVFLDIVVSIVLVNLGLGLAFFAALAAAKSAMQ